MATRSSEIRACYVCVHVWCAAEGSEAMRDELRARLAGGPHPIQVMEHTCFGVCHKAPSMVLYPEGTWYPLVQPTDLEEIVAHVQGGATVERLTEGVSPRLHELVLQAFELRLEMGTGRV